MSVPGSFDDERAWLRRHLLQRLDDLRRAGLDRVPKGRPAEAAIEWTKAVAADQPAEPALAALESEGGMKGLFAESEALGELTPLAKRLPVLETLRREVATCPRCPVLVASRTKTVFGEGSPTARLMFIGEAPGADEDRTGRPFVGRAGRLLDDMITKGMGLKREDVYIANVIKCRPPENRVPLPDEIANCSSYLETQLAVIRPEFLCLLGKTAASALLETNAPMGKLRGRWHSYKGIKAIVTYHPAYLLRNPAGKRDTWEDLKMLMTAMGLPTSGRKGVE